MTRQIDRINKVAKMVGNRTAQDQTRDMEKLLNEDDINIPFSDLISLVAKKLGVGWVEAKDIFTEYLVNWT